MEQPNGKNGPGCANRMASGQPATCGIDDIGIKARPFDHSDGLHGIGLHHLGLGKRFPSPNAIDGGDGRNPRLLRISTKRSPIQKGQASASGNTVRHDKTDCRPIRRNRSRCRGE
jgi:hypothetical protein